MAFEPDFLKQREVFEAEKRAVTSVGEWVAFRKKWFPTETWPQKSAEQRAAQSARNHSTVEMGGRWWGYTADVYDLTPEARYIYISTCRTVGDPLQFPLAPGEPRLASKGWRQECPFCELYTKDLRDDTCPQCGRALVYFQEAD